LCTLFLLISLGKEKGEKEKGGSTVWFKFRALRGERRKVASVVSFLSPSLMGKGKREKRKGEEIERERKLRRGGVK